MDQTTSGPVPHSADTPVRTMTGQPSDDTPPADWVRVADLARELEETASVAPRSVRRWITRRIEEDQLSRVAPDEGGTAELWLSPAAADQVRTHYDILRTGPDGTAQDTPGHVPDSPDREDRTPVDGVGTMSAEALEGWREALAGVEAERDRLRSERDAARQQAEQTRQAYDEAERGRHASQERLEALKGAWWRWYALASSRPWWRRVGRLPDPPAELTADRLLSAPE